MTVQFALDLHIRVATYNVCNLFLCGEGEPKSPKALRALTRAVDRLAADVLVMQEVGSQASLDAFNARLKKSYPCAVCQPGNSTRGIHLAVLSRWPIEVHSHRDRVLTDGDGATVAAFADHSAALAQHPTPVGLQRDVLQVHTGDITLFGVHLKSKANPAWQCVASDDIRHLEARAVAAIVDEYHQQHQKESIILLGDFNDVPDAPCLAPLTRLGWTDPHGEKYARLGRNPSTYWPKRRTRLDRMLVSPETVQRLDKDTAELHSGEMLRRASDHYPISIDLVAWGQ